MKMNTFGTVAAVIGLISVLYGLLLSIGLIAPGAILGITAGGAFNGAQTFFLMAIAFFLWECNGKVTHHE